jgi:hypothetical protein
MASPFVTIKVRQGISCQPLGGACSSDGMRELHKSRGDATVTCSMRLHRGTAKEPSERVSSSKNLDFVSPDIASVGFAIGGKREANIVGDAKRQCPRAKYASMNQRMSEEPKHGGS